MPSTLHESLVQLFRDCPRLTVELLCTAAGTEVTPDGRLRATSEDFTNLRAPSYRADAVLLIEDAAGQVCRGLILEVQRRRDLRKRMTWPVYVTNLRAALGVPVTLVVVAPSRALARWCATPIVLDTMGNVYRPPVLGPGAVPAITDPAAARAFPELAVLSAVMHGYEPDAEHIGLAALAGCETLDSDLGRLYADVVLASLSKKARLALEALMALTNYRYQSQYFRNVFAEGREQGLEKGLEKGMLEGQRTALRKQLEHRFGPLPEDALARIETARRTQIDRWLERVLSAGSLRDVLGRKR